MKLNLVACLAALGASLLPAVALADDPNDPSMRSAASRARDRAIIKQMNQRQLAYVRERDARIMRDYRRARSGGSSYSDARAQHAGDMAEWRRAVAACNSGQWEYCDN